MSWNTKNIVQTIGENLIYCVDSHQFYQVHKTFIRRQSDYADIIYDQT